MSSLTEVATLGGGCFWCLEAVFQQVAGVANVASGYAGGSVVNPTYEHVCSGTTGHAEVVQVTFDPTRISYQDLLNVFFAVHDPTTPNRQGGDVGTQYRSVIFYTSDDKKQQAEAFIKKLTGEGAYDNRIVTDVKPLDTFYEAESYHHTYYQKNPDQAYCQTVINPKLKKLKEKYA